MRWANSYYQPALARGTAPCVSCGRPLLVHREQSPAVVAALHDPRPAPGIHVYCTHCNGGGSMRLSNLILYLPAVWTFWNAHPRLQTLPHREMEVSGRAVLVTRLQSVADAAYLDIVAARDLCEGSPYDNR